jgi:hypothetical protein
MGFQTPPYGSADYLKRTTSGRIYALVIADGVVDWMYNKTLDKVKYVGIRNIFPYRWCLDHGIDERRESIVHHIRLSAATNRSIGGVAPRKYKAVIEKAAGIGSGRLGGRVTSQSHPCLHARR